MKRMMQMLAAGIVLTAAAPSQADERHFSYVYEADSVLPKGGWEFEQWVTHRGGKVDGRFTRWDFREELEYGVTDRLTTALYLNFNAFAIREVPGFGDSSAAKMDGISSEWKYMWLSPHTHFIGFLPYVEVTVEDEELELEEKFVFSHNFANKSVAAFNIVLEQEFERQNGNTSEEGILELTAGYSYPLNERWSVGVEGRNHREFPNGVDYEKQEHSAWFLGPNVHYGDGKWWGTLTVLPQTGGSPKQRKGLVVDEHEEMEVRFVGGVFF